MKNGEIWKDTDGELIQAHGGCILEYDNTYYWYGENKDTVTKNYKVDLIGFSCYSSKDMIDWKNEGVVLKAVSEAGHELHPDNIAERPKVLYNKKTKKFIMWFHLDKGGYGYARVGVASADSPTGPFIYAYSLAPDCQQSPCGRDSRDMYLYQEEDGTAYHICSSDWNSTTIISRLTDDYMAYTGDLKMAFIEQYREAQVLIKEGGLYYMFSSGCTGWAPNSMLYGIAKSPMGTWRLFDNPCSGKDYRKTFYGQTANAFKLRGQWYIMLDHWKQEDLKYSGYSFLPINIDGYYVEIPWVDEFNG